MTWVNQILKIYRLATWFVRVKSAAYKEKSASHLVGTVATSWLLDKLNIYQQVYGYV